MLRSEKYTAEESLQLFSPLWNAANPKKKCTETHLFFAGNLRKWENSHGINYQHMQGRCTVGRAEKTFILFANVCSPACVSLLVHVSIPGESDCAVSVYPTGRQRNTGVWCAHCRFKFLSFVPCAELKVMDLRWRNRIWAFLWVSAKIFSFLLESAVSCHPNLQAPDAPSKRITAKCTIKT